MPPALFPPDPPLSDGVVALRAATEADAPTLAAWGGDAEIVRWTRIPTEYGLREARAWLVRVDAERRAGLRLYLLIADAANGELLGACDVRFPGRDRSQGEVGYMLAQPARGRGVATRALRLLARHAFDELGVRVLRARVDPRNARSLALAERVGFRREPDGAVPPRQPLAVLRLTPVDIAAAR